MVKTLSWVSRPRPLLKLSIGLMEDTEGVLVNIVFDDNYYDKGTDCLVGGEQQ